MRFADIARTFSGEYLRQSDNITNISANSTTCLWKHRTEKRQPLIINARLPPKTCSAKIPPDPPADRCRRLPQVRYELAPHTDDIGAAFSSDGPVAVTGWRW
jgi:hypothetical protein